MRRGDNRAGSCDNDNSIPLNGFFNGSIVRSPGSQTSETARPTSPAGVILSSAGAASSTVTVQATWRVAMSR